jgi:hypothetical protein
MENQNTITAPVRQLVICRAKKADESQIGQLIFAALAENHIELKEVSLQEMKLLLVEAVRATRNCDPCNCEPRNGEPCNAA